MAEAETKDTPEVLWFYSTSDDVWYGECATRDEVIAEGRANYADGEPFQIAQGRYQGPYRNLFEADWLADHIDDCNDDRTWEEGFRSEAGIDDAKLGELVAALNAVWADFCDKHKPVSRSIDLWGYEDVPGTPEWQAREAELEAARAAISRAEA